MPLTQHTNFSERRKTKTSKIRFYLIIDIYYLAALARNQMKKKNCRFGNAAIDAKIPYRDT